MRGHQQQQQQEAELQSCSGYCWLLASTASYSLQLYSLKAARALVRWD
eukprot:SAG25_NODE_98_length_15733_cov_18.939237_10_plen_48_part_00